MQCGDSEHSGRSGHIRRHDGSHHDFRMVDLSDASQGIHHDTLGSDVAPNEEWGNLVAVDPPLKVVLREDEDWRYVEKIRAQMDEWSITKFFVGSRCGIVKVHEKKPVSTDGGMMWTNKSFGGLRV